MELRKYFEIIWKWWWLVLLSVLIASASSYYASKRATPLFRSKTTLMVGRSIQNPDPNSTELYTTEQLASTYVQMVTREPVLKGAVESLGWDINWEQIAPEVTANVVPQTQLIEIYATDSDPYTAKVLADTVAQQLIKISPSGANQVSQEQLTFIQAQLADLQEKINSAKQEVTNLNAELDASNSAREIQDLQNQINIWDTKISNWQSTYAELLKSIQGGDVNALNIVEEGTVPTAPFSPNIRMNVLLAAAIGLVLSVSGIFTIEYLDDTIQGTLDTQRILNLPTLAKIGRINGSKNDNKLIALENPRSPDVDSFRMLRINLQSISNWQSLRTILFTSAEPSVGKSVTISNLAIVMAQFGKRVILVESDLRKPVIHSLFGIANENGLKDLIEKSGLTTWWGCLKTTKIKNLLILPAGTGPISSVEALGSERMKSIVDELSTLADVILFDSPPALMFSDAFLMGKLVNGVVIVSKAGRTRIELLKRVVNDLRLAGINLLGVVVQNRKNSEFYGYKYYKYYSESVKSQKEDGQLSQEQKKTDVPTIKDKEEKEPAS
jgi:capsular exopolysaccharide synthesis family protein